MVPILQFPDIWHNITYIAGFFKILLGIFIVITITNEFQFNTIRLNLSNGLSRIEFITSKFLLIFIISLVSVGVVFTGGLVIGLKNYEGNGSIETLDQSIFLIGYFLEILLYLALAVFIGIWLKKTGISIVALLIYPLLLEPIIRWQFPDSIDRFFPVNAMDELIVFPFPKYFGFEIPEGISPLMIGIVIAWIIVFYVLSIFILKRKSL
jgi:ABC-type transport system involved in multi-copper enzyme maturation permease subunit